VQLFKVELGELCVWSKQAEQVVKLHVEHPQPQGLQVEESLK
jgi:hypothetical protein